MTPTKKSLPIFQGKRILDIYKKFKLDHLPKILSHKIVKDEMILEFEWIEGSVILPENIEKAFYELGRFHSVNRVEDREIGFTTVCHGDFHRNNIIDTGSEIKFVDVTYIKEDWNYSDLDYIDFYGWFDKEKYPWMIESGNCLQVYHEGLGISLSKKKEEELIRSISIHNFKKLIANAIKNKIDTSFEESCLKRLESK
jgi:hypothetical protein